MVEPEGAAAIAARVRATLEAAGVRMSLGTVTWWLGADLDALLHEADAAMYADKRNRRGRQPGSRALTG